MNRQSARPAGSQRATRNNFARGSTRLTISIFLLSSPFPEVPERALLALSSAALSLLSILSPGSLQQGIRSRPPLVWRTVPVWCGRSQAGRRAPDLPAFWGPCLDQALAGSPLSPIRDSEKANNQPFGAPRLARKPQAASKRLLRQAAVGPQK
jgi:hypothetical protein